MTDHAPQRQPNRLIHETSPYLLQHAYNPVDWYPWGPEALAQAAQLKRPILLSIGYSSCHWCHVMERESFENESIARLMNEHFICIKVDREERPDLDEIYMQATLALNRNQGGWPMTVFLTPDQKPFFAGTYFPPEDRWGRPGFPTLLKKIAEFWDKDQAGVTSQAANLTARLQDGVQAPSPTTVGEAELDTAVTQFAEEFDAKHGGFGGAPKFPPATGLSLLLHCYHRTKDPHTLTMVRTTLDAMAAGGIYDQVGGGFARYSTDERWLVPHFEKMLYDNALLARVYVEAYQVTGDANYRRIACETLEYVLKEMTSPEGGFFSATDADSEGVEGKFFVWTPDEIRAVVGNDEDAKRFCAYYDVTAAGNWEHQNVLHTPKSVEVVAKELGVSVQDLQETLARVKPMVYAARAKRVAPGLDDKIITAWNGMMISAMAEAGRVFDVPRYREAAQRAADFLLTSLSKPDGRLLRTYRAGKAHLDAYLEDYAYFAEGLIDTYETEGDERYLSAAARLAERIVADFSDAKHGGFFTTASGHEALILRSREGPDGATPSGNAVAASVLARLSYHLDRDEFRQAATAAVRAYGRQIARYPRAFAKSLLVVDLLTSGPVEIALVGRPDDPGTASLRAAVSRTYLPNRVLAYRDPKQPETIHPLLQGKTLVQGKAALYVCRNFACRQPITDPADLAAQLDPKRPDHSASGISEHKVLGGASIPGAATVQGTAAFAARKIHETSATGSLAKGFGPFGRTGLTVSRLGFGTYRVGQRDPEQREALIKALRGGCNLIDTSTNYMDGESEQVVGSALQQLIAAGEVTREEVLVVSKIGYVQGQNLLQAQAREKTGKPYPDMVKYGEDIWHCIHPEFLADQLMQSLDRLGLASLDVCLLHNPEYFLSHASRLGSNQTHDVPELRQHFYARLQLAFEYFESQVQAGRIKAYGVSSNTAIAAYEEAGSTSLSRMVAAAKLAAQKIGSSAHHFAVVQCPMNLHESGAALTRNTGPGEGRTLLQEALHEGIAVLVNRPLNAMPSDRGGVVRLADMLVPSSPPVKFERQREKLAALEEEYRSDLAPAVAHSGQGMLPSDFFRWADELSRIRSQVQGVEHWEQIESHMIAPHVNQVLRALSDAFTGTTAERWEAWRDRYVPELLALLKGLQWEAAERSRLRSEELHRTLNPLLPEEKRNATLSQKALWVLASTPGVTAVLVGMRSPAYVDDALEVLRWDPLPDPRVIYDLFASKK